MHPYDVGNQRELAQPSDTAEIQKEWEGGTDAEREGKRNRKGKDKSINVPVTLFYRHKRRNGECETLSEFEVHLLTVFSNLYCPPTSHVLTI